MPVLRTAVPVLIPAPGANSYSNINKMAALSKGTFLMPETGNDARHLYVCFQMNYFLCCKYLTIHQSIPTKVSTSFQLISFPTRKDLSLPRTLFKQI